MKFLILIALTWVSLSATCNTSKTTADSVTRPANCYKARLQIKGICSNYVIKVLEGDTSGIKLQHGWIDETDDKSYDSVFALENPCSFPDMAEGAEFHFTVVPQDDTRCNVCMAYRPVPAVKNRIRVSQTPCR